ncbi:endoribonuclease YbeY isoform X1 [Heteronotia binoei]|uniref:endoribonuclease YbeY isoform X1 n=1 Tax=Heteronotia binoei TaxID=13085 RepID=UPI00292FA56F|nr:endoribonuclease YbeY isoform X1 [Heteronotia binoei]XP_060088024.1 endoribonuclease YbeY isoform X1 [Heteronotia binoei]XP_060088034.1 endoribonuclease YbeY isoform X1 [Heteronotia binoei]
MSLVIRNLQRAVPVRRALLRKRVDQIRHVLGVQQFDLAVICISNHHIQRLNRTYRSKNAPTDVLSFPFHENLIPGKLPEAHCRDELNLGDIFLGVEYIYQQCEENKEDYSSILTVTVAHGLCHLLGYKHNTKEEWQQMYEREAQILQEINRLSGTNLQPLTKNHF